MFATGSSLSGLKCKTSSHREAVMKKDHLPQLPRVCGCICSLLCIHPRPCLGGIRLGSSVKWSEIHGGGKNEEAELLCF